MRLSLAPRVSAHLAAILSDSEVSSRSASTSFTLRIVIISISLFLSCTVHGCHHYNRYRGRWYSDVRLARQWSPAETICCSISRDSSNLQQAFCSL